MAGTIFRNAYGFDPETYGGQRTGGLLGLLQQVMEQQGPGQQQGGPSGIGGPIPSSGPDQNMRSGIAPPWDYANTLTAPPGPPTPQRALSGNSSIYSPDPNFRQLSRAMAVRPQGAADQAENQSIPSTSGDGTSPEAAEQSGAGNARPAPVLAGFPRIGGAFPMGPVGPGPFFPSPMAPGSVIPIPMPHIPTPYIPEAWRMAWSILQLYPSILSGLRRDARPDSGQGAGEVATGAATDLEDEKNRLGPMGMNSAAGIGGGAQDGLPPSIGASEWWASRQKKKKPHYARVTGVQNGGSGWDDDRDDCISRHQTEEDRCNKRMMDYPHWDFLAACKERAQNRRNMCVSNGGRPRADEPAEWGDKDDEVYRNLSR